MGIQIERAHLLKNLHVKGDPLILFNIWDAGSAQIIQETGAKVIAKEVGQYKITDLFIYIRNIVPN